MSAPPDLTPAPPLDLAKWRPGLNWAIGLGLAVSVAGAVINRQQFGYSWLLALMFYLSLAFGAWFLVMMHHLFDAGWSVPIRRACEHLACLASPALAVCFLPIAVLAPRLYPWLTSARQAAPDHALEAKLPLLTPALFAASAVLCFAVWYLVPARLRAWSVRQDETGAAVCTRAMRRWSAAGIFLFAVTLTLGSILWVKTLEYHWYSTMYGVYYFAGSVWVGLATVYVITRALERAGLLRGLLRERQYYFLGSLLLAFTVFYAYIHFSQYFVIWNGNVPEEVFYYTLRERGSWYAIGLVLIFGHFFLPFVALLRIDVKHHYAFMVFVGGWAWLMHYLDLSFNIMPTPHPEGFPFAWVWLDLGCFAFIGGVLVRVFLRHLRAHAPYPTKDPRLAEALGQYHPQPRLLSGGELGETEALENGTPGLPGAEAKGNAP